MTGHYLSKRFVVRQSFHSSIGSPWIECPVFPPIVPSPSPPNPLSLTNLRPLLHVTIESWHRQSSLNYPCPSPKILALMFPILTILTDLLKRPILKLVTHLIPWPAPLPPPNFLRSKHSGRTPKDPTRPVRPSYPNRLQHPDLVRSLNPRLLSTATPPLHPSTLHFLILPLAGHYLVYPRAL